MEDPSQQALQADAAARNSPPCCSSPSLRTNLRSAKTGRPLARRDHNHCNSLPRQLRVANHCNSGLRCEASTLPATAGRGPLRLQVRGISDGKQSSSDCFLFQWLGGHGACATRRRGRSSTGRTSPLRARHCANAQNKTTARTVRPSWQLAERRQVTPSVAAVSSLSTRPSRASSALHGLILGCSCPPFPALRSNGFGDTCFIWVWGRGRLASLAPG